MRSLFLSSLLSLACTGESVIEKQENAIPTIIIVSHSDGVEVQDGYAENFRATVSDDNNDFPELQIAWYVGTEIVCDWEAASPAGDSTCDIIFEEGDENVIAEVRDPSGAGGRAELSISVLPTAAPTTEIFTPTSGNNYYSNQLIQFSGIVGDIEDDVADLTISWSSSIDGELPLDTTPDSSGEISDYAYLSEGQHAIELRVEDSSGKVSSDEVVLLVGGENSIPLCEITAPLDSSASIVGDTVIFRATVSDADIAATDLYYMWNSDKDGELGQGTINSAGEITFSTADLSPNTHGITLVVEDEIGESCQDTLLLFVGNPPTSTIESPLDGEVFSVGEAILFRGSAVDSEDQLNNLTYSWHSSEDESLDSGALNSQGITQFSSNSLSAGLHSISLSVTDSAGLVGDDIIAIRINTPPETPTLSLAPTPIYSFENLTVSISNLNDTDGDTVTPMIEWFENGVLTSFTGSSVVATELDVGETWTVRVTPNDGYIDGAYAEESITIANSLPEITAVTISNAAPLNDDVITCAATAADADEALPISYTWLAGGVSYFGASLDLSTTSVLPTGVVECTAAVTDSQGASDTETTAVTIANRSPVVGSVSISSSGNSGLAYGDAVLTCSASPADPDGESLTTSYEWTRAGIVLGSAAELQLSPSIASPSDIVSCTVTTIDSSGVSDSATGTITIENTAPVITDSSFEPAQPRISDNLTCAATAEDLDGSNISLSFAFQNMTTSTSYSPTSASATQATLNLSSLSVQPEDIIACEITATDADSGTDSLQTTVTIINTAPVFDFPAAISPNPAYTNTELTCTAMVTDPDDGALSPAIIWTNNGVQIGAGPTYIIDENDTEVGDTILCTATATDSDSETTTDTATVIVQNTLPAISNISITGSNGIYNSEEVECLATVIDPDETISPTYIWMEGSTVLGSGTTIDLATTSLLPDDSLTCVTNAVDSNGGTAQDSTSTLIINRAPEPFTVSISPANPIEGIDDLSCSHSGASADADGEAISYSYSWASNSGGSVTGATVSASLTSAGESWTCAATATDGSATTQASAAVTIDPAGCPDAPLALTPTPADLHGYCWYMSQPDDTCDNTCANISGGSNLTQHAQDNISTSVIPEGDPTQSIIHWWIVNDGNPAGFSSSGGSGWASLGYGYLNSTYYGRSLGYTSAAFPGNTDGLSQNLERIFACACLVSN